MTKVVNSHVLQLGAGPDAPPGLLQIGDVGARQPSADDPGVAVLSGQGRLSIQTVTVSGHSDAHGVESR